MKILEDVIQELNAAPHDAKCAHLEDEFWLCDCWKSGAIKRVGATLEAGRALSEVSNMTQAALEESTARIGQLLYEKSKLQTQIRSLARQIDMRTKEKIKAQQIAAEAQEKFQGVSGAIREAFMEGVNLQPCFTREEGWQNSRAKACAESL